MKAMIDETGWYPVYQFENDGYGTKVEITEEQPKEFLRIFTEFQAMQKVLCEMYKRRP